MEERTVTVPVVWQDQLLYCCAVCSNDYLVEARRHAGRLVPDEKTHCPLCGGRGRCLQP
jgi:hypothetical protein